MSAIDLTGLTASVTSTVSVEASAITLLDQLSTLLKANAAAPAAILDLANQLDAQKTALANAITANTPPAA